MIRRTTLLDARSVLRFGHIPLPSYGCLRFRRHFASSTHIRSDDRPLARITLTSPMDLDLSPYLDASRFWSAAVNDHSVDPEDFVLYPSFFDDDEQKLLLRCSLAKLDAVSSSREARRKRKEWRDKVKGKAEAGTFMPDEAYAFEEGHFDGVIENYRETQVLDWDSVTSSPEDAEALSKILHRLYPLVSSHGGSGPTSSEPSLKTSPDLLTHILHLSSDGKIDPHVDNVDASGDVILGVSLGGERVMRLKEVGQDRRLDVLLAAGSVYVQRRSFRFRFEHSIPKLAPFKKALIGGTQRVSIMLRDRRPEDGTKEL